MDRLSTVRAPTCAPTCVSLQGIWAQRASRRSPGCWRSLRCRVFRLRRLCIERGVTCGPGCLSLPIAPPRLYARHLSQVGVISTRRAWPWLIPWFPLHISRRRCSKHRRRPYVPSPHHDRVHSDIQRRRTSGRRHGRVVDDSRCSGKTARVGNPRRGCARHSTRRPWRARGHRSTLHDARGRRRRAPRPSSSDASAGEFNDAGRIRLEELVAPGRTKPERAPAVDHGGAERASLHSRVDRLAAESHVLTRFVNG
jgi:hypothetical protein